MSQTTSASTSPSRSQYLTPQEYRSRLQAASAGREPARVLRLVDELADQRFPAGLNSGCYYLPTSTLLRCYEAEPDRGWARSREFLGPPQSPDLWQRASLLASRAFRRNRWTDLGEVAFFVDQAVTQSLNAGGSAAAMSAAAIASDDSLLSADVKTGIQLRSVFLTVIDPTRSKLGQEAYLKVALSFFRSLPKRLILPVDWFDNSRVESGNESWQLLRLLWMQNRTSWQRHPAFIDKLAELPHPFLPLLADEIRHHQGDADGDPVADADAPPEGATEAEDPFSKLMGLPGFDEIDQEPKVPEVEPDPKAPEVPEAPLTDYLEKLTEFVRSMGNWLRRGWQLIRRRFFSRNQ